MSTNVSPETEAFWHKVAAVERTNEHARTGLSSFDYVRQQAYRDSNLSYIAHVNGEIISISPAGRRNVVMK